jgi:hypothetical protein
MLKCCFFLTLLASLEYGVDCMLLPFYFATLDSNVGEVEGEEVGEEFEEDQGLTNQGKPSFDLLLLYYLLCLPS